ncbi:MAG: long-chain fatty acid--CoA ligase [Deltaproteobacteria bacterium]|nr:long-chain fatty acid--CoA ligase [Deltaproteobacteria bacterium]
MENRPWTKLYDTHTPTELRYPQVPIQEFLRVAANMVPDKPALDYYGSLMTFRELRQASLRLATALAAQGVGKGDRVALHLPNCPQYVLAYFAVLHLGAIVVNVNPQYTPSELKHIMDTTTPKALFTFNLAMPLVQAVQESVEPFLVVVTALQDFIKGVPASSAQSLELPEGWLHFSEMLDRAPAGLPPRVAIKSQDPAVIMFTGGTTGFPKGAVLTHGNYVSSTTACCLWSEGTARIVPVERRSVMSVLPFFHVYGQICCLHYAMYACATMILVPKFDIEEFMGTLERIPEITFFPAVPALAHAIVNHPRAGQLELDRRIKLLNNGGGPMALSLIEQVEDLGILFSEGWGMTETTSMGIANPFIGLKKHGSIGIPLVGADVKVVDTETGLAEVPTGTQGEIIIKCPYVMSGYWNNPEETANQLKDGWLHTGDVAIKDEDGYIFIVDRKKDMIIAGGFNIYPREIDEVLYQHPKVSEAVALGVPDPYRGETVKAFVVLKPGATATAQEITDFCRERLTGYKVPKMIEFRASLPKSAVGKLLRKALRDEELAKQNKDA